MKPGAIHLSLGSISSMAPWPLFVVAGAVIGLLIGLFGVGGSSIATLLLAVLGLPVLLAVATPLPEMIWFLTTTHLHRGVHYVATDAFTIS